MQVTYRGRNLCDRSEQSEHPTWSSGHWRCLQWRGRHGFKSGGYRGSVCLVEWRSDRRLNLTCGSSSSVRWSELWVHIVHNQWRFQSYQCPYGVLIQVSRLVVFWGILGHSGAFWVSPKGILIIPHYLGLDMALDIAIIADSNSMLDCQKCSKTSFLLLLYIQVLFKTLKN